MIAFTDSPHCPVVDVSSRLHVAVVKAVVGHHPTNGVAVPSAKKGQSQPNTYDSRVSSIEWTVHERCEYATDKVVVSIRIDPRTTALLLSLQHQPKKQELGLGKWHCQSDDDRSDLTGKMCDSQLKRLPAKILEPKLDTTATLLASAVTRSS